MTVKLWDSSATRSPFLLKVQGRIDLKDLPQTHESI